MRSAPVHLILLLLSSCVQEIPIELPDTSNQLAVSSIIYPDKLIFLNVSYVNLFSDTTSESPRILEISIKEDGVLIDNPKGKGPEIYSSTYPKVGSVYELTVRTDMETVTARTTIPPKVKLIRADDYIGSAASPLIDWQLTKSIAWEDPPGQNFYEMQILDQNKLPVSFFNFNQIDDPILQQECDLDYFPSSFVLSDRLFDGRTCNLTFRSSYGGSQTNPHVQYVVLRSISEEYYQFKKSWHRHVFLQNTYLKVETIIEDYNIFPLLFQGDPVPLYSNIDKGFGIFAGFNEDVRKFKVVR